MSLIENGFLGILSIEGGVQKEGFRMPRESPYEIILSPDEARELSVRSGKYTLPYFQVFRAKIILLAAEGFSNDSIARSLDTRR